MRVSTLSVALSGLLAAAVYIMALFPPVVKMNVSASAGVSPAQRVALFTAIVCGYATIDEGAAHLAAASRPALEGEIAGTMRHVYPALGRIPVISNSVIPDPEQVLYLRPDAVFVYTGQAEILKKAGQPGVVEIQLDPKNPIQSRERIWSKMGKTAGKDGRVKALSDKWAAKRAALKMQLSLGTRQKLRVAYVPISRGDWMTTNNKYFLAYKLGLVGAQDASKDLLFLGKADLEQLLLLDPDVILFASNAGERTTLGEIISHPEFQSLRAVRERRVYRMPELTYMNEPVEDRFLLTWMAEVFYPDIMPRRLRADYKETYREVYHYAISDDEIDRAIALKENLPSAGYERFIRGKPPT